MSVIALTIGGAAVVVSAAVLARELRAKRQQAVSFTAADRALMLEILGEDADLVAESVVAVGRQGRTLDPNRITRTGRATPHNGLDIPGPRGTEVYAVKPSVVVRAGTREGYGNVVELSHLDVPNRSTAYAHLDDMAGVTFGVAHWMREGDVVAAGDVIGHMGNTGIAGMGVHLHLEVHPTSIPQMGDFNRRIDPLVWLAQQDPPIAIAAERWDGGE